MMCVHAESGLHASLGMSFAAEHDTPSTSILVLTLSPSTHTAQLSTLHVITAFITSLLPWPCDDSVGSCVPIHQASNRGCDLRLPAGVPA